MGTGSGGVGAAEWEGLADSYFFRFRARREGPILALVGSMTARLGGRGLCKNLGLTLPYSVPGVKVWFKGTQTQVQHQTPAPAASRHHS